MSSQMPRDVCTAQDYLRHLYSPEVAGAFEGSGPEELAGWQTELREWLSSLFSRWDRDFDDTSCPQLRVLSEEAYGACTRQDVVFSNPTYGTTVSATILFPPPGSEKNAGVLCQHGHGDHGRLAVIGDRRHPGVADEIDEYRYDFGAGLAAAGYHVVAMDLFGFGKRTEARSQFAAATRRDPCDLFEVLLSLAGQNMVAMQVNDIRRALTLLQGLDGVDEHRIGMAGLSQGGRMAMYTAAVDMRLSAVVASGACNTFRDRVALMSGACGAQVLPGLFPRADTPELFGSLAPRPLQLQWGRSDPLIIREYAEPGILRVRRCYAAAGAAEALDIHRFDGGHEFDLPAALAWLDTWLGNRSST